MTLSTAQPFHWPGLLSLLRLLLVLLALALALLPGRAAGMPYGATADLAQLASAGGVAGPLAWVANAPAEPPPGAPPTTPGPPTDCA